MALPGTVPFAYLILGLQCFSWGIAQPSRTLRQGTCRRKFDEVAANSFASESVRVLLSPVKVREREREDRHWLQGGSAGWGQISLGPSMKLNVKQGTELSRKIPGIVSLVLKTCVAAGLIFFWLWSRSHESNNIHVIGFISLASCVFAGAAAGVLGSKAVGAAWGAAMFFVFGGGYLLLACAL